MHDVERGERESTICKFRFYRNGMHDAVRLRTNRDSFEVDATTRESGYKTTEPRLEHREKQNYVAMNNSHDAGNGDCHAETDALSIRLVAVAQRESVCP